MRNWIACATLAAALLPAGRASAEPLRVHALRGARIVVEPGQVIESGTVVLRDGLIEAVGVDVDPPADARLWELEGFTVYAGLIEPYATRNIAEDAAETEAGGGELVAPDRRIADPPADEETVRRLREAGFTTALVAPAEGLFRGRGALLNLGEGALEDNLLRDGVAQFAALARSDAGYPRSLMGSVALFRQTLIDAAWQEAARRAWQRRPGQPRPPFDPALAALAATAAGEELIVIETADAVDTLRLVGLIGELGLDAWLVGNGEEYRWLEPIGAAGLPLLLPVAFPDPPEVPEEDDLSVGLAELRHWDEAPANPRRLLDAGLTVALTSHGLAQPGELHGKLSRAIDRGLTADEALAALTTTPARLLGIADRAGSVTAGKMANLVVVEGELFGEESRVRELWIDGRHYEIDEPEPTEADPAATPEEAS